MNGNIATVLSLVIILCCCFIWLLGELRRRDLEKFLRAFAEKDSELHTLLVERVEINSDIIRKVLPYLEALNRILKAWGNAKNELS